MAADPAVIPPWFRSYIKRGFHLIDYDPKKKGPEGSDALDWTSPERRITSADQYRPDRNWGVFTGVEIQPGRFLVDVDFDWVHPSGLHKALSNRLLPDTFFTFGRDSRPVSHAFFTLSQPVARQSYEDLDKKTTFVELRGTTDDGSIGWQTMLPQSIHPSGEVITLRQDGEISHHDDLPRRVQLYAVACLVLKYLGEREFRHDLRLALAGFLLAEGLSEDETQAIGEALAVALHNDVKDVRFAVKTTALAIKKNEPVKGAGVLSKLLGNDEAQGREIVKQLRRFLGTQVFQEDKKGNPLPNQHNIRTAFEQLGITFRYNQFSRQMIREVGKSRMEVEESIFVPLWLRIDRQFHVKPSKEYFYDVLRDEGWQHAFHPVRDYLDALTWDGVNRIETWLINYAHAKDSEYVRAVSAIVLMAAVRRVRQPGCKFDEMLILESAKQGTGKSTMVSTLCPDEEWFGDDLPLGVPSDKVIERTGGKWLLEASELHGNRQKEADHMKSFLSRRTDGPVRLAWDKVPSQKPRQFILIGTTNSLTGYLKDFSGARRFWPVRVDAIDLDGLRQVRDQLWAEAAFRESQGESIRLSPQLWEDAEIEQDERRAVHPWEELIDAADAEEPFLNGDFVPVQKIWTTVGVLGNQRNNTHAQILQEIMQRKGFTKKVERRWFEVVEVDGKGTKVPKKGLCWVKGSVSGCDDAVDSDE